MIRKCKKCGEEKDLCEFNYSKNGRNKVKPAAKKKKK